MKKISLHIAKAILILLCLAIILVRIVIWYSERTNNNQEMLSQPSVKTVADRQFAVSIAKAKQHVALMMKECKIPGLSIAVSKNGKLIWSGSFGYVDKDKKIPADPNIRFRIASISKSLTASGMMKLVQQSKLDLYEDVRKYVPEFPDKGHPITSEQLASHRSGIRSYWDDMESINTKHYTSVIESIEKFGNDSLLFTPGTDSEYSGYGFVLLSAVIERASGKPFLTYMKEDIFLPLGMYATTADDINDSIHDKSNFYDNVTPYSLDGSIVISPKNDFSNKWAPGGFLSTAEDLIRFGNAHIPGNTSNFLKDDLLDTLLKPRFSMGGIIGYGFGWMSAKDPYLRPTCFHFGASSGGTSVLVLYPKQRVVIAILGNLGHAKFPYNRLMNIINAFVDRRIVHLYNFLAIVAAVYLIWKVRKSILLIRQKIKNKKTHNYEQHLV